MSPQSGILAGYHVGNSRSFLPSPVGVASGRSLSVNNASLILRDALDALASVVFPAPCRICAQALTNASRIPICETCLGGFERIVEPMCLCCGRPFVSDVAAQATQPLCRLCRVSFYSFDRARSFAIYDDALSEAIVLLKYDEVTRLGDWFAARLAEIVSSAAKRLARRYRRARPACIRTVSVSAVTTRRN